MNKVNTIWLVEDNPVDLFIHNKVLKQGEYADVIISKPSAEEAIQSLSESTYLPELILLDIRMPEMDGFEFLERLSALPNAISEKVKVVLLSSSIDPVDFQRAIENPLVLGFIPKPLTREKLNSLKL